MSLTKIQTGIAVMVALAIGTAIYEADIVHQQSRKQIATENDRAALTRQVSGLERQLSDVRDEQTRLANTLAERRSRLKASSPAAGGGVSDSQLAVLVEQIRVRQTLERNNPEFQRLQREVGKHEIGHNYGPLYQTLGLSPAQIQRFEAAMAEHQGAIADIEAVAQIRGSPDSAAEKQLEAAANEQLSLALREVLGPGDYPRFERFRESTNVRCNVTEWLAGALYATATPLDRAQAEELTQILIHNTTVEAGRANSEAIDWDTAMIEARRVLSAGQFSALEAARAQNEWTKVFYQAINAAYHKQAQEKSGG